MILVLTKAQALEITCHPHAVSIGRLMLLYGEEYYIPKKILWEMLGELMTGATNETRLAMQRMREAD